MISLPPGPISGDGHLEVPPDRWMTHVPAAYRDFAPRLVALAGGGEAWLVEGSALVHNGTNLAAGRGPLRFRNVSYWEANGDPAPGTGPPAQRIREQDIDGIAAELLYPPVFISRCIEGISEPEAYRAMVWAYNEFLAEYCSESDRLIGVGIVPITGIDDAVVELEHIARLGIPAVCPQQFPNGSGIPDATDDGFWEVAIERRIGVTPHAMLGGASNRPAFAQSAAGRLDLSTALPARASSPIPSVLAQLVTCGVFDRLPELQMYFAETNAGWLPHALFMLDDSYAMYKDVYGLHLSQRPSELVLQHVRFGIVRDPTVLRMLDLVPAANLIWGSDFPHSVGSWPHSVEWIGDAFKRVDDGVKRRIVRSNVLEFLGVPFSVDAATDSSTE